jgi:6,7-dimethyl-8-ribityllumazine synthase
MNQIELPTHQRVAVIEAGWFADIVHQATDAFIDTLAEAGVPRSSIDVLRVPGAFEIPLVAQKLARSGKYAAVAACALVVDGGIYRHDFVSATVIQGLMDVQLRTEVPVFSVVLTPHHFHEHRDHHDYFHQHFRVKGASAAQAVIETLANEQRVAELIA